MAKAGRLVLVISLVSILAMVLSGCSSLNSTFSDYTLSSSSSPGAGGTVIPASGTYRKGVTADLTATPAPGYRFDHWEGDASGTSPTIHITIDGDKNTIAFFVKTYTLSTSLSPTNGGSVSPASGTYDEGDNVTLIATPAQYWRFDRWSGDVSGSSDHVTVTMDSNRSVVAAFIPDTESISTPMTIPVLVVKYFPVSAGMIDISVTGDVSMPLDEARNRTDDLTTGIIKALEDGSRYHYYKDPSAQPSLKYQVVGTLEYLDPLPTWNKPGISVPMTDYNQIMTRIDAQNWIMGEGVKEIWIWGYDGGKVKLWESNMSSPWGDISNSDRDGTDLPVFGHTYTVYHYNYGRGVSEAVEDHMHQNEAIFRSLNYDLFWNKFVGKVGEGRCGWSHYPPNGVSDYDWANPNYIWTDIEDWKPDGSGQKVYINSDRWNRDSLTWFIYWMQSTPGMNNSLYDGTKKLANWWIFIGAYDQCKAAGWSLEN